MLNVRESGLQASELGLTGHLIAQLTLQGPKDRIPHFEPLVKRLRNAYPPPVTPLTTSSQGPVSASDGQLGPTTLYGTSRSSHGNHHFEASNVAYQQSPISEGFRMPSPGNHLPSHDMRPGSHNAGKNVRHVLRSQQVHTDWASNAAVSVTDAFDSDSPETPSIKAIPSTDNTPSTRNTVTAEANQSNGSPQHSNPDADYPHNDAQSTNDAHATESDLNPVGSANASSSSNAGLSKNISTSCHSTNARPSSAMNGTHSLLTDAGANNFHWPT